MRPGAPTTARERLRRIEADDGAVADLDDDVAALHARALCRPVLDVHDDEAALGRQHLDADAGIARSGVVLDELVAERREVRGVRIAERREHRVHGAEVEHALRQGPVVPGRERLSHLVDRGRDRDRRGRDVGPRQHVSGHEGAGEDGECSRQDERAPHADRGSIRPPAASCQPGR